MRRPPTWIALLLLLAFLPPVVLVAAAAIVQVKAEEGGCGAGACTLTFASTVTTGNTVLIATGTSTATGIGYTASDATNGSYTKLVEAFRGGGGTAGVCSISGFRNVTGGFTTVTVTPSSGTSGFLMYGWEVSGVSNSATILTGSVEEIGVTNATLSSTGLSGTGVAVGTSAANNNPTLTAGSGWTKRSGASLFNFAQDKLATFASDVGAWTAGSSINHIGCLVLVPQAATAGGCRGALNLLGVGGC